MLSTEEINLIADAVFSRIVKIVPRDVLTVDEAIKFVGKDDCADAYKAFDRWKTRNNVRPCAKGRYSLRALKAGLEREARKSL